MNNTSFFKPISKEGKATLFFFYIKKGFIYSLNFVEKYHLKNKK